MSEIQPAAAGDLDVIFYDGRNLLAGFDDLRLEDRFASPADAADYFRRTDFATADKLFADINRAARGLDATDQVIDESCHIYIAYDDSQGHPTKGELSTDIAYVPARPLPAAGSMEQIYDTARDLEDAGNAGLALRMGTFLTQRFLDGNSRSGAIIESLRQRGYDGSVADRLHYASLAKGSDGIAAAGRTINTTSIQALYASSALSTVVKNHDYEGPVPAATTAFEIAGLAASRLDLPQDTARWVGGLMAEQFFGLTLTVQHSLQHGRMVNHVTKDVGGRPELDSKEFFYDIVDLDEIEVLYGLHDATKVNFLNEIAKSFRDRSDVLGTANDVRALVASYN